MSLKSNIILSIVLLTAVLSRCEDIIIYGGDVVLNINNYCSCNGSNATTEYVVTPTQTPSVEPSEAPSIVASSATPSKTPSFLPTISFMPTRTPTAYVRPTTTQISTFIVGGVGNSVTGDDKGNIYYGDVAYSTPPDSTQHALQYAIGANTMFMNTISNELFIQSAYQVRKLNLTTNTLTTIFGVSDAQYQGYSGDGGKATSATSNGLWGVWCDSNGNTYVGSFPYEAVVRVIDASGIVNKYAGTVLSGGYVNGPRTSAKFGSPIGITGDSLGNMFISESGNRIRKINTAGIVSTFAGTGGNTFLGENLAFTSTPLYFPGKSWFDVQTGDLYAPSTHFHRVHLFKASTGLSSTYAGNGLDAQFVGDGGSPTAASLDYPHELFADTLFTMYVAQFGLGLGSIRMIKLI